MACDCNTESYECPGISVSSNCVIWRGPAIPLFGICPGDPITYVEQQIIDKINELIAEQHLALSDFNINTCPVLRDMLAVKDPTLADLLQQLWTDGCTLRQLISRLEDKVDTQISKPSYPFRVQCTTPPGDGTSSDAILQGVINKVCALQIQVNSIAPSVETIVNTKVSQYLEKALRGLGNRGIVKSGTAEELFFLFTAFVPPYVPLPYYGPLTNFDAAGKGLAGTPYEGWFFLSGLNGMADARGRTLVAAVKDVPGPVLDAQVDPARPENPGTGYIPGQKFGNHFIKLEPGQMPVHTHTVNDPGHAHKSPYPSPEKFSGSKFDAANQINIQQKDTSAAKTGITIGNAGGDQYHDNRQPSLTITGYIMRTD